MSRYYQILCNAISLNDSEKLKEIGEIIDKNILTYDVRDFCIAYQNDKNFLSLLSKSQFDQSFKDKLLNWIYKVVAFQVQHQDFEKNYLIPLIESVSKFSKNPIESNTVGVELIVLNNTKLKNSILIYLALSEGYIRTLLLPSEVKTKYFSNLITLAFNYIKTNPPANEEKISQFFTSLLLLRDKGFTINNLTEILMVQPVWTLSYINKFYDIFKDHITKEELQSFIIQMTPIDWQYVTIPFPSIARVNLIIDHVRNHSHESLGTRAFNSMNSNTTNNYKLAFENPFGSLLNEPLIPVNTISTDVGAPNTISHILQNDARMSPLPQEYSRIRFYSSSATVKEKASKDKGPQFNYN